MAGFLRTAAARLFRSPWLVGGALAVVVGSVAVPTLTAFGPFGADAIRAFDTAIETPLGATAFLLLVGVFLLLVGTITRVCATTLLTGTCAGTEAPGPIAALRSDRGALRDRVTAAIVGETTTAAVASGLFVAVGTVLYALLTLTGVALYALGDPVYQPYQLVLAGSILFALLCVLVGSVPVMLGTGLAARGVEPSAAPLAGLRFGVENPTIWTILTVPAALLGGALLVLVSVSVGLSYSLLLGPPPVVALVTAIALAAAIVVGTLLLALVVALHETIIDRYSPGAEWRSVLPSRRYVVAGLVVLAVVGGATAAVRIGGIRPVDQPTYAVTGTPDPEAVAANARSATDRVSHRATVVERRYNWTTESWERTLRLTEGIDIPDTQRRHVDHIGRHETFVTSVLYADRSIGGAGSAAPAGGGPWNRSLSRSVASGRPRLAFPGPIGDGDAASPPTSGADVCVRNETAERLTVGIESPDALSLEHVRRVHDGNVVTEADIAERSNTVGADSYARLTVEKSTGYPVRYEAYLNVTRQWVGVDDPEYDRRLRERVTVRYRDWRSHEVHRPDGLGSPSAAELLLDALSY